MGGSDGDAAFDYALPRRRRMVKVPASRFPGVSVTKPSEGCRFSGRAPVAAVDCGGY
jgi:hypothetical protein